MYYANILLVFFAIIKLSTSSPTCASVTHSDCDIDAYLQVEVTAPNKDSCQMICTGLGETCHFSIFDTNSFARGNCRLYDGPFFAFIYQCNELSGPRDLSNDCDLENPLDNTCEIYRSGKCQFGRVEETEFFNSWENCHNFCLSNSQCQLWQFEIEQNLCKLQYSKEASCSWEISPREPSFNECDDATTAVPTTSPSTTTKLPTTLSTTTSSPLTCDVPKPQERGDWFCLPSNDPNALTCHLECDPGYVSDGYTMTKCHQGVWSSSPTCVAAVALITGGRGKYADVSKEVQVYGANGLQKKMPDLPYVVTSHSVDLINNKMLLCGGFGELGGLRDNEDTDRTCLILTPSLQWIQHSITAVKRYYHSSVAMLGKLHLLGGGYFGVLTEYLVPPSDQWNESWRLEVYTSNACAVKVQADIMITTGGSSGETMSDVLSYNITSGEATRLKDLTKPRSTHGCVYYKQPGTGTGAVLVAGGWVNGGPDSSSEMYDMKTGKWSTTGKLTAQNGKGRQHLKMVVLEDNILAMGGADNHLPAMSDVESFNMVSKQWTKVWDMTEGKYEFAVAIVPPNAVGISLNQTTTN